MTNEAVIIELLGAPGNKGEAIRYTVLDAEAIGKGDLLILSGSRVATPHAAGYGQYPFAGIAATEKVANDGSTTIGAWTKGIFDMKISGVTCSAGDLVALNALDQNCVDSLISGQAVISGAIVGKALEDGSDPETIAVRIGVYG